MGFFKKLKERLTSPKATIFLKLNKNTFVLGEKLEGTMTVASEEEFDAMHACVKAYIERF